MCLGSGFRWSAVFWLYLDISPFGAGVSGIVFLLLVFSSYSSVSCFISKLACSVSWTVITFLVEAVLSWCHHLPISIAFMLQLGSVWCGWLAESCSLGGSDVVSVVCLISFSIPDCSICCSGLFNCLSFQIRKLCQNRFWSDDNSALWPSESFASTSFPVGLKESWTQE